MAIEESISIEGNKLLTDEERRNILDLVYPIDSIYISLSATDPGLLMGGTWERFGEGRTLLSVDPNNPSRSVPGAVGGNMEIFMDTVGIAAKRYGGIGANGPDYQGRLLAITAAYTNNTQALQPLGQNSGGVGFDGWPPYITVYMWRRTG